MDDSRTRLGWKVNSKVDVYSASRRKWFPGVIERVLVDAEGEWLEIRYNQSTIKQLQRYSADVRPSILSLNGDPTDPSAQTISLADLSRKVVVAERGNGKRKRTSRRSNANLNYKIRMSWKRDDVVKIFSTVCCRWYAGKIADVVMDDEGEWLNVNWTSDDGEAMFKQVQRFSTQIQMAPKSAMISSRGCRAPVPCGCGREIKTSFSYPASGRYRRVQKLVDIVEEDLLSEHTLDICAVWVREMDLSGYPFDLSAMVEAYVTGRNVIAISMMIRKNKSRVDTNVSNEERSSWKEGNVVEIFSAVSHEWYFGKIVKIFYDNEGEWLDVMWERDDGQVMCREVQRFAVDVRPAVNGRDGAGSVGHKRRKSSGPKCLPYLGISSEVVGA